MKMDDVTSEEQQPPPDFVLIQAVYLTALRARFFKTWRSVKKLIKIVLSLFFALVERWVHEGLFMSSFCVMTFLVLVLGDQQESEFLSGELSHLLSADVLEIVLGTRLMVNENFWRHHSENNLLWCVEGKEGGSLCTQW